MFTHLQRARVADHELPRAVRFRLQLVLPELDGLVRRSAHKTALVHEARHAPHGALVGVLLCVSYASVKDTRRLALDPVLHFAQREASGSCSCILIDRILIEPPFKFRNYSDLIEISIS